MWNMGRGTSSLCCGVVMMLVTLLCLRQPAPALSFNANVPAAFINGGFIPKQKSHGGDIVGSFNAKFSRVDWHTQRIGCAVSSKWLSPSMTLASGMEAITQKQVSSPAGAKRNLLRLLTKAPHESDDHDQMKRLLETMERTFVPIQTVGFFNLAIKGEWYLCYTNSRMPPIGPRLSVKSLYQKVDPGDGNQGKLVNVLEWHLLDEDVTGRLEVECGYELDRRGRMVVSLEGHRLLPDNKMPRDPAELVGILQRAIPYDMFDPKGSGVHTSFLDGSVRVVRMEGGVHEGRMNIFVRDPSVLSPAPASEEGFSRGQVTGTEAGVSKTVPSFSSPPGASPGGDTAAVA